MTSISLGLMVSGAKSSAEKIRLNDRRACRQKMAKGVRDSIDKGMWSW